MFLQVNLRRYIRDIPDFPQEGILFRDITPLLADPAAFGHTVEALCRHAESLHSTAIVGIEARGFLFGAPMAERLGLPFVPIRKPGKLPGDCLSVEYSLEYGAGHLEVHRDALEPEAGAYIVDDLLATGGTAEAAVRLIEMAGGQVMGLGFVIELVDLRGRDKLADRKALSLVQY